MAITTVLFDLDGTLLPMDQDVFTTGYFKSLCKKVAPLGYEPEKLVKAIWAGMAAMVKNDGSETNEKNPSILLKAYTNGPSRLLIQNKSGSDVTINGSIIY